jgi:hypothetical protein
MRIHLMDARIQQTRGVIGGSPDADRPDGFADRSRFSMMNARIALVNWHLGRGGDR